MWGGGGLNFSMRCSIKVSINKFKVEISSLLRISPSDATLYARGDPYVQTIMP